MKKAPRKEGGTTIATQLGRQQPRTAMTSIFERRRAVAEGCKDDVVEASSDVPSIAARQASRDETLSTSKCMRKERRALDPGKCDQLKEGQPFAGISRSRKVVTSGCRSCRARPSGEAKMCGCLSSLASKHCPASSSSCGVGVLVEGGAEASLMSPPVAQPRRFRLGGGEQRSFEGRGSSDKVFEGV
jgi:hypothetical protein